MKNEWTNKNKSFRLKSHELLALLFRSFRFFLKRAGLSVSLFYFILFRLGNLVLMVSFFLFTNLVTHLFYIPSRRKKNFVVSDDRKPNRLISLLSKTKQSQQTNNETHQPTKQNTRIPYLEVSTTSPPNQKRRKKEIVRFEGDFILLAF